MNAYQQDRYDRLIAWAYATAPWNFAARREVYRHKAWQDWQANPPAPSVTHVKKRRPIGWQ